MHYYMNMMWQRTKLEKALIRSSKPHEMQELLKNEFDS